MKDIFFSVFLSSAWQRLAKLMIFGVLAFSISACSILDDDDDDDDDDPVSENAEPTANAGADQSFFEGDEVTLAGSGTDSDGSIESYAWSHVTSNSGVELSGENTATASFTAPGVSQDEEMVFRLTVTDDDGETHYDDVTVNVLNSTSSSQVLFASQYELKGASNEPYANSHEGGDVYGFSSGFTWIWSPSADGLLERQLYGNQHYHSEAIDENSYFGFTIKAPNNGSLDISATDTMVIQMGNELSNDTTHMVVVVDMKGGEQDPNDYSWTHSCSYEQELLEGSQSGDQLDPPEAWDNGWGVQTYRIPLAGFDCGDSSLADIKVDLEEVAVKVVGGVDEAASAVADNHVLLQFGYIGFSDDNAPLDGDGASPYVMFASQYEVVSDATGDPYVKSNEQGGVYEFSGGGFAGNNAYTLRGDDNSGDPMKERQLYGVQYFHMEAIGDDSYFGLSVKAPNDGALDISETDTLVIQMGEGTGGATAHTTFTIDLNGGEQDSTTYVWSHSCSYDQELLAGSQPGDQLDPAEGWDNDWGIQTYRIPLSSFECGDDDFEELKADLEEVAVKVVGGKDAEASAAATENHTLLQFGYIAFAADGNE